MRKYQTGAEGESMGNDVKFSEFVQYLVGTHNPSEMHEHWQPLEKLCRPCEIEYDCILHHETLAGDLRELVSKVHLASHIPPFPIDGWHQISMQLVHSAANNVL